MKNGFLFGLFAVTSWFNILTAQTVDVWNHIEKTTAEKYVVQIDYIADYYVDHSYKPNHVTFGNEVYINIKNSVDSAGGVIGEPLKPTDKVSVVFLNFQYYHSYEGAVNTAPITYLLEDIPWQVTDGHFSGKLTDAKVSQSYLKFTTYQPLRIHSEGYGGEFKYRQEFAVVINGTWLTNPDDSSHNFKINMYDEKTSRVVHP